MSTTQRSMSLRELAGEYAGGRIDRQTYLLRRARLFNELASYTPQPAQQQKERIQDSNPELHPTQEDKPKSNKLLIGLTGTLFIFILAGLLIFKLTEKPESAEDKLPLAIATPTESPPATEMIVPPTQDTSSQIVQDPIKQFIAASDWSPESRTRLLRQWDNLASEKRQAISSTSWFLTFSSELRTMIEEERGLAAGKPSTEVDSLLAFAAHLGLEFTPVGRESIPTPSAKPVEKKVVPSEESK